LQTLLSNALRFTEQGQVVLSVYAEDARKTAHRLLFEVSDTGSGISEDLQEKIFRTRPAEEPSRKPDGSGPGLPVVRELVKRMGGSISLKSRPGEGTVFRVSLPFAAAGDAESPQSQSNRSFIHQFQPLDGLKVLYVEDVIPNQFLMEGLCDTWNVELDTALNGLEALEKVKNNRYDLILMDIQMPEMDGYQTAGEIRKLQDAHYRNVPIFALSGSVSEKTQSKIRETGMDDYIAKPINPYDLHHKLSTVYLSEQEMATIRLSPRVASPEASKIPEADQPGFAEIRTLYANDPAGYVKILQQILKLTEESAATIEITLKRGDEPKFRSSAHKIMSYIRLLQLQQLQTLLKNIKDNFEAVAASPESTIKKLRAHFNYLIEQLKLETQQYSS
jgi:CheY-like chemotaxis protein